MLKLALVVTVALGGSHVVVFVVANAFLLLLLAHAIVIVVLSHVATGVYGTRLDCAAQDLFLNLEQRVADVSKDKENLAEEKEQMGVRLAAAEEKALRWQAEVCIHNNSLNHNNHHHHHHHHNLKHSCSHR